MGTRPRALRAPQGRHRVPDRDQPQPARDRRGPARLRARSATSARASAAVAELAAAEELFRGAFDGSPIGMALTDDGGARRARQRRAVRPHRPPRRASSPARASTRSCTPTRSATTARRSRSSSSGERNQYKVETRFVHVTRRADLGRACRRRRSRDDAGDAAALPRPGAGRHAPPPLRGEPALPRDARPADRACTTARASPTSSTRTPTSCAATATTARCCCSTSTTSSTSTTRSATRPATSVIARVAKRARARGCATSDVLARLGGDEFAVLLPQGRRRRRASASPTTCSRRCAPSGSRCPGTGRPHDDREHRRRDVRARRRPAAARTCSCQRRPRDVRRQGGRAQPGRRCTSPGEHAQARMQRPRSRGPSASAWRSTRTASRSSRSRSSTSTTGVVDAVRGAAADARRPRRPDPAERVPVDRRAARDDPARSTRSIVARAIRAVAAARRRRSADRAWRSTSRARRWAIRRCCASSSASCSETGLDPGRVIFEITETAAIANIGQGARVLRRARRSSAAASRSTTSAPASAPSTTSSTSTSTSSRSTASSCATLRARAPTGSSSSPSSTIARGLGKETSPSTSATTPTVALLRELGVDYGQGSYLGKPQPLERFLAELAADVQATIGSGRA